MNSRNKNSRKIVRLLDTETPKILEVADVRGRVGLLHDLGRGIWEMEFWDIVTLDELRELVHLMDERTDNHGSRRTFGT
jgi:hypothetical protein